MSALTEAALSTAEEHVFHTFRDYEAATLASSLLFDDASPFSTADIARALTRLESEHALLRYTWDGSDWVTLTVAGIARRNGVPIPTHEPRRQVRAAATPPQIIHEHPHRIRDYRAYVLGSERSDGTWNGWLEFVADDGTRRLRTGQETSQPNRAALEYWASGLEDVYLDGAIARARS